MTSLQSLRVVTRSIKLASQFNFDRSNFVRGALVPVVDNSAFFANFSSSARMSSGNEHYQEKVEDLPGMKFPEASGAKKPEHERNTHHEQHEKVRESEELGGYTDEAQADAAAKSAAYFEFRKGAHEAQQEGGDKEDAHKKAQWANKQTGTGGFTDTQSDK